MAAVSAVLDDVALGGVIVAPEGAYSGTLGQLHRFTATGRISVRLVDITDTPAVVAALDGASLLWIETPTNPLLGIADLGTLVAAAHQRVGARLR